MFSNPKNAPTKKLFYHKIRIQEQNLNITLSCVINVYIYLLFVMVKFVSLQWT